MKYDGKFIKYNINGRMYDTLYCYIISMDEKKEECVCTYFRGLEKTLVFEFGSISDNMFYTINNCPERITIYTESEWMHKVMPVIFGDKNV